MQQDAWLLLAFVCIRALCCHLALEAPDPNKGRFSRYGRLNPTRRLEVGPELEVRLLLVKHHVVSTLVGLIEEKAGLRCTQDVKPPVRSALAQ